MSLSPCLLLSLAVLPTTGCDHPAAGGPTAAAPAEHAATVVSTVHPERRTLRPQVSQPGYIQAYEQTPVYSKIAGYVQKVHVDIGDVVMEGTLLAELWVPELEVEVVQKEALVGEADVAVKQAREAAAVAAADFRSATAKMEATAATRARAQAQVQRAESQYTRLKQIGRDGTIGREDVEEIRLGAEAARAGLQEVEAQVRSSAADRDASQAKQDKAQVDIRLAEARLAVAKASHELARRMFDYRRVTAPFDGVVTQRNVDTRAFVQPATSPRGDALFVVMRTDTMRVRVQVPEADAAWVEKGAAVDVHVQALKSFAFHGKLTRTAWSLDRTTRTLLAEVDVPEAGGKLRPGMYAYATITAERPNVWALPLSAVVTEGDVLQGYRSFVYRIVDGQARRTPVDLGVRDQHFVEVLKLQNRSARREDAGKWEDFTGREVVVRDNLAAVSDGQAVTSSEP